MSVKLADAAGISYSEIATKAYESGRTELAIKVHAHTGYALIKSRGRWYYGLSVSLCWSLFQLLEFEPRSGEQVPLLLKMKKSPLALSKAIESGDTDLGTHTFTYSFQNLVENMLKTAVLHKIFMEIMILFFFK